jgi:surface polysaccharide O-acyltransferase-like enzyme
MNRIGRGTERLYGIDLLKIVSMLMVVLLHILIHGHIGEKIKNRAVCVTHTAFFLCD